jgi:serine/threonine-protein kinase
MSGKRRHDLERICQAALDRDPHARSAFLAEACAGDDALRREVEALLAQEAAAADFMEVAVADAAERVAAERDAPIGRAIGPYRVVSWLGAGGMGEVYRARDTRLDRDVALKMLSGSYAQQPDWLARFRREAKVLASLSHPNIAAIYGLEESNQGLVLALELVEGPTLADRLAQSAIPLDEALPIAMQIAEAMKAAHERGVIHRDLKPANIKLRPDGVVKVLDFGLAKAVAPKGIILRDIKPENILVSKSGYAKLADFGLAKVMPSAEITMPADASVLETRRGVVMGTAAYMSPEQAAGAVVDQRSDVFSFGIVLHEMLSGRRPFAAASAAQELQRIVNGAPDPLPASLPRRLQLVVRKALERLPERRYQTMRELVVELQAVLRESADDAIPRLVTRRFKWIATAFGTLLAAGLALWLIQGLRQSVVPDPGTIRSLAVLPLKPLEASKEGDYLGLGLADTIITRIGQIEGITVRPTGAVGKYTSLDSDPLKAGRELQADAVLDGTVQRSAGRVRVNMSLFRVRDGAALWTDTFNVSVDDLFALEDEISQRVVSQLRLQLSAAERLRLTKHHTSNPQAYEYYLKGVTTFATVGPASPTNIGDVKAGLRMLEEAVKLDPNYAVAYAQLGWGYTWVGLFSNDEGRMWIDRAREALARADALDPNLAESHVVRHLLLWSAFEGYQMIPAFEELRTAQRINPNVGHFELGGFYAHVGLLDQALRELRRALEIDPTNESVRAEIPNAYWYNALYEEAIAEDQKLERPVAGNYVYYLGPGRTDEARRMIDQALTRNPDSRRARDVRGWLLAVEGKYPEARAQLLDVDSLRMNRVFHHVTYTRACIFSLMGDATSAVQWLDETVKNGMPIYPAFFRDHCFDKVRKAPEFVQFMAQLKPVWEQYERQMR